MLLPQNFVSMGGNPTFADLFSNRGKIAKADVRKQTVSVVEVTLLEGISLVYGAFA